MAEKISIKNLKNVPWFLAIFGSTEYDFSFLTSKTIPESVSDTKEINIAQSQIPGGKTTIKKFGSFGARTISFNIKFASFDDNLGVTPQIAVLQTLRYSTSKFFSIKTDSFVPPPKVIYYHTASTTIPLVCICDNVDFTTSYPNVIGKPQVVDVSMRLLVDEDNPVMKIEEGIRKALQYVGAVKSLTQTLTGGANPYKKGGFF